MDFKYLTDGQKVSVIGEPIEGKTPVKFVLDDGEEEFLDDRIELIDKLFDNPPTEVYSGQIRNLRDEVSVLRDQIYTLRTEKATVQAEYHKACKVISKKSENLIRLSEYIQGKKCAIVDIDNAPKILNQRDIRGLSIRYDLSKDVVWVNCYVSDYYSEHKCIICAEEDAAKVVQQAWDKRFSSGHYTNENNAKWALDAGVTISPSILKEIQEKKENSVKKEIEKKRLALQAEEAKLAEL